MLALIPCRKGSKRLPGKGMKLLGGKPLIDFTLRAAYDSECFTKVVVSTDWKEVAEYAAGWYGCEIVMRPPHLAEDLSPDIAWVKHALGTLDYRLTTEHKVGAESLSSWDGYQDFSILRPTSPFRGPETIERAKVQWAAIGRHYDSMRAVRRASETGWKQWTSNGLEAAMSPQDFEIEPLTSAAAKKYLHSRPTQSLTPTFIQTAALEMCWTRVPLETGTISGEKVAGFLTEGLEALDLNDERDWEEAERALSQIQSR